MNNNLNSLTEDNMDQTQTDNILKSYINRKFDIALKQELENHVHSAKKEKVVSLNGRKLRKRIYYITAVAASLSLLMIALTFLGSYSDNIFAGDPPPVGQSSAQLLAFSYLDKADIHHSGALKGNSENLDIRRQAILAFNTEKYAEAQQYFSQIEEKTEEDIFYSAIASLYNQEYDKAIANLKLVTEIGSRYKAEANWYLAITYIFIGDETNAKAIFSQMKPSTWNYDEARAFLKALD